MSIFLAVLTYFAYVFIIVMYSVKLSKISGMPQHLRWELYPVIHEPKSQYGSAYRPDEAEWQKNRNRVVRKGISFLLKENFQFSEYFKRNRGYWLALFPWHIGFILIVAFHILCFFGALLLVVDVPVSAGSSHLMGKIFYYLVLLTGVISFFTGSFGSIGLLIKRVWNRDLRAFATPQNYLNYLFTLAVFTSGLYSWYFTDATLAQYREFWRGLVTLSPAYVESATAVHIILFALFLIYLPFTRSLHYLTKFLAFLWIRWEDRPNIRGSKIEINSEEWLNKPVSWSAPHIPAGKTWSEIASEKTRNEKES